MLNSLLGQSHCPMLNHEPMCENPDETAVDIVAHSDIVSGMHTRIVELLR